MLQPPGLVSPEIPPHQVLNVLGQYREVKVQDDQELPFHQVHVVNGELPPEGGPVAILVRDVVEELAGDDQTGEEDAVARVVSAIYLGSQLGPKSIEVNQGDEEVWERRVGVNDGLLDEHFEGWKRGERDLLPLQSPWILETDALVELVTGNLCNEGPKRRRRRRRQDTRKKKKFS